MKKRQGLSLEAFPLRSGTEANTCNTDYIVSGVSQERNPQCLVTEVMPTATVLNVDESFNKMRTKTIAEFNYQLLTTLVNNYYAVTSLLNA